ncbi:MAG: hypothetical protein P4L56_00900 [Candidatus Sulfopaludibacter sp.]|nr:hypothetical protein [Candidatus Sulfopaludibacter sp.]
MTRPLFLRAAAVATLAVGGLTWMNSVAPIQWPSVLAYSGIVVFLLGALSVLAPPAWSGFSRRIHGLLAGVVLGAALFGAPWFWPVHPRTIASPASRLDVFLPTYDFQERHELTIDAPAERVREALNQVSFADIPLMQTLGRIRALAMGHVRVLSEAKGASPAIPIVAMIQDPRSGFFPLDDTPREFVFGLAGQPWNNAGVRLTPAEFLLWAPPETVKIAANFLIQDAGSGRSRVITETRILASDASARGKMTKYWALIYPGSGLIRRGLLEAVRDRAARTVRY